MKDKLDKLFQILEDHLKFNKNNDTNILSFNYFYGYVIRYSKDSERLSNIILYDSNTSMVMKIESNKTKDNRYEIFIVKYSEDKREMISLLNIHPDRVIVDVFINCTERLIDSFISFIEEDIKDEKI